MVAPGVLVKDCLCWILLPTLALSPALIGEAPLNSSKLSLHPAPRLGQESQWAACILTRLHFSVTSPDSSGLPAFSTAGPQFLNPQYLKHTDLTVQMASLTPLTLGEGDKHQAPSSWAAPQQLVLESALPWAGC
jgi:hypothetical protein